VRVDDDSLDAGLLQEGAGTRGSRGSRRGSRDGPRTLRQRRERFRDAPPAGKSGEILRVRSGLEEPEDPDEE
jgi:hypothetical protein